MIRDLIQSLPKFIICVVKSSPLEVDGIGFNLLLLLVVELYIFKSIAIGKILLISFSYMGFGSIPCDRMTLDIIGINLG